MIDTETRKPLRARSSGIIGNHIKVLMTQLAAVQHLLDCHEIRYTPDEWIFSYNGKPEATYLILQRDADLATIQAILDEAD